MKILIQISSIFFVFFISSCELREDYELPSWDVEASAPIATSSVSFDDLLGDTALTIDTLGDKSLVFVYQKDLVEYNFDEIVELNSVSISRSETIGHIDIDDVSFSDGTNFGEVVSQYSIDDGISISANSVYFENELNNVLNKTITHDASDDFQEINFANGILKLTLINGFDVDLSNIIIDIYSEDNGQNFLLNTFNIANLNAGSTYLSEDVDLSGEFMTGNIIVSILNIDIPAQTNAFIVNYSDELVANVDIMDIQLDEAIVILPYQELINEDTSFVFDAGGALLDRVKMSSGDIKINISSSLNTVLKFEYTIPKANLNGEPFSVYREIPAGGTLNEIISLANYEFDLTGQDGNQNNTIFIESFARIDSTGEYVSTSVDDGVECTISIENISPYAAWGYLGQDTVSESRETSFLDLRALKGDIDFEFVEVKMVTENNLGVAADLHILKIESSSDETSIQLESPLLASPFTIDPAFESMGPQNPITAVTTEIIFDESNSNIDKIIESKPNSIAFDLEMVVNGDNDQSDGFIYLDYGVSSELQIEIPVSMKATKMVMKDTVDLSLSVPHQIIDGSFTILVENEFPFDAEIKLELMNNAGLILETLESEDIVRASEVNIYGRTIAASPSVLNFPFQELSVLMDRTRKIGIEITLNTQPDDQFVKLYSDYSIDMTVIVNVEKLISQTILE